MIEAPSWSPEELEADRAAAIRLFREQRLQEPLDAYLATFDRYQETFQRLFERTVSLSELRTRALDVLSDEELLEAFRYIAGPPISADDLMTLADAESLRVERLKTDAALVQRVTDVIQAVIDRRRFPWALENRSPTENEKNAAVIASAALLATRRLETARRNEGKRKQEATVEQALKGIGLVHVRAGRIQNVADAPDCGQFSRETKFGDSKADFVIRLWDSRLLALECKVSNSYTNSIKRLNREAAGKAESWYRDFGRRQVVAAAVLGGVYKLLNLEQAQESGLAIFWDHDLHVLTAWIEETRAL